MSALHQIDVSYEMEQDRLLLRASSAGGEEYRLWLTRRYAGLLLQILQQRIERAGGLQQLASDRRTAGQLRQGARDQPWDEAEGRHFPLGRDGILGYAVKTGDSSDGALALQLLPREGQGLNLNLDAPLLYLLYDLLEQAVLRADWNLPLGSGPTALH